MQTVLIIGATGNIGASAIHAALRSKLHVLAIVRNQASAEKLFRNVGTREGITTVEAYQATIPYLLEQNDPQAQAETMVVAQQPA